jgi:hypothetical protein
MHVEPTALFLTRDLRAGGGIVGRLHITRRKLGKGRQVDRAIRVWGDMCRL